MLFRAVAVALLALSARAADPPSFTGVTGPFGDQFFCSVTGVSGDGSVVCGFAFGDDGGQKAFRWTASGGSESLGALGGPTKASSAHGISADGTTIVGWSTSDDGFSQAFRWTEVTGMQDLFDLPGTSSYSVANAVSADGGVIVGRSQTAISGLGHEGFRWTQATGVLPLGDLPGASVQSEANAVSANGTRIAGFGTVSMSGPNKIRPARWSWPTPPVALDDPDGGSAFGEAFGISANGHVLVGVSTGTPTDMAFRWSNPDVGGVGMELLGVPPEAVSVLPNSATSVSADGNVVVGWYVKDFGIFRAFVWTAATGPVDLETLLTSLGVDFTGWELEGATISADGRTIVGNGWNAANQESQGWVVHLGDAWTDLGRGLQGVAGVPALEVHGSLIGGHPLSLELSGGKPGGSATLVLGLSALNAPFKGGTLVPNPDTLLAGFPLDGNGALDLHTAWPTGLPSGFSVWVQAWIADAAAVQGFSASNGVVGTQP